MAELILVSNPGSASRKYALYTGQECRAQLHFEYVDGRVVCTLAEGAQRAELPVKMTRVEEAAEYIEPLLRRNNVLRPNENIARIALRIVAPGSFFLEDRIIDDTVVAKLEALESRAPLHIHASLTELKSLRAQFGGTPVIGVSDSAFHATKPPVAQYYAIPLDDAHTLDIKRFGYHGLSGAAVVEHLRSVHMLPQKLVICHLGSGASVMAVQDGKSIDTSMGYSPLEGVMMATRSGSIDVTAAQALQSALKLDAVGLDTYLNKKSGLLGVSGASSGVRELVELAPTHHRAELALHMYAYNIQKMIGQMAAALGGVDMLVFTGTVGERSAPMRARIVQNLAHLGFILDTATNATVLNPTEPVNIALIAHSKQMWVIPTDESAQIVRRVVAL